MLSTKSQKSFLDQKSQKLVWKKDEDNELLDDLKQGVEAGKRSLGKYVKCNLITNFNIPEKLKSIEEKEKVRRIRKFYRN